jgi:hypothetical protein
MKYLMIAITAFSINAFAQVPPNGFIGNLPSDTDGDSLIANSFAQPDIICSGQTVQLFALPGGGSSNYTFTWTSDPPGFTSDASDPLVAPLVTTTYTVELNDGINTTTEDVTVIVKPLPNINLIPENDPLVREINSTEIGVCVYDSVTIDAGNPGSTYLWSNGSTEQTINIYTSGISFDLQEYEVTVTDMATGCSNNSSISVHFSFTDCTYGVEEKNQADWLKFYPNPSTDGLFSYIIGQLTGELILEVFTSQGTMIKREVIPHLQKSPYTSTLYLSDQTKGVYLLKVYTNRSVFLRKLIIQ